MQLFLKCFFGLVLTSFGSVYAQNNCFAEQISGNWKIHAIRYYEGKEDGVERQVSITETKVTVFETHDGISTLSFEGNWRLDSLDDGNYRLMVYLSEKFKTPVCNTLVLQFKTGETDDCIVHWFENYLIGEEEKLSFYRADFRFTKVQ